MYTIKVKIYKTKLHEFCAFLSAFFANSSAWKKENLYFKSYQCQENRIRKSEKLYFHISKHSDLQQKKCAPNCKIFSIGKTQPAELLKKYSMTCGFL